MELTYNELRTREVINVVDGKSLGKIVDLTLSFPEGKLRGITVPGRRQGFFSRLFDKGRLYIDRKDIKKIGGDVILVSLNCGDTCSDNVEISKKKPVDFNCQCPPPCQPSCPPKCPPSHNKDNENDDGFPRIDLSDY